MFVNDFIQEIERLKKERNAVILAHNYERGEIQDVADFVGDSLGLSRQAAATDADVIVFCGVYFMAETAAVLCPDKTVLIPDPHAGCQMANMIMIKELRKAKAEHPDALVVCYVNSTAEIKAESHVCCTSANAVEIVASLPKDREIIFIPDKYLSSWVAGTTGRTCTIWNGYCPTHVLITEQDINIAKEFKKALLRVAKMNHFKPVSSYAML